MKIKEWLEFIHKKLTRHPLRTAYIAGLLYYGYKISWLRGIRSSELTEGGLAKIISITPYLIAVVTFSCIPFLFVWLFMRLKIKFTEIRFIWLTPLLWVLSESLVSNLFSLVSSGIGSKIGDYWHFGSIGLNIVHTPLLYISRWGGLYLLSFCVVMLVCSGIYAIKTKRWMMIVVVGTIFVALSALGFFVYSQPNGKNVAVTAVGSEVFDDKDSANNPLPSTVSKIPNNSADIVVLPEYSRYWEYNTKNNSSELKRILKDPKGLVIDSSLVIDERNRYNVVSFSDYQGNAYSQQPKWFTVPGGEFVPYIFRGPLRMFGQGQAVRTFESTRSISPGKNKEQPFNWNEISYGALACSAANAPELYRSMTLSGAQVLINTAALGTVGLSSNYHEESFAQSKLQAVANARPFVQSARGGYNFILDSNGKEQTVDKNLGNVYIQANVTSNSQKTIYTRYGNWIVYVAAIVVTTQLLSSNTSMVKLYKKHRKRFNDKHKN